MEFRDLKKQYQVLKAQMDKAVIEVMTDCNFISGKQVKVLEEKLAAYVGVKHCITCGNGTDALMMLLMAWGIRSRRRSVCPRLHLLCNWGGGLVRGSDSCVC